ncbi:nucleotidyl transferase AbiEii/AbiGii toxin family protein, partial [Candidatus Daviesbacteria bacterium]|nr:nucleotidyl transferase AbiEii/AbiGii toxin family protein [Candidatus Daviesbacteria bacterium]
MNFTSKQQLIFKEVSKSDFLKNHFYFTGETALSTVYLNHRLSDDLDFFSEEEFEILPISNLISGWIKKYQFKVTPEDKEAVKIFNLEFHDREKLKVDFGYYPYQRLKKGKTVDSIDVDSLFDIAVNKLQTIRQRSEVKDFVDL